MCQDDAGPSCKYKENCFSGENEVIMSEEQCGST